MPLTTLIIRTAGTNCDRELAYAFELAGSATQTVHLNMLIENPSLLDAADLVGFPGGFSYGDDIAAGRILANRLKHRLYEPLRAAIARGVPMIGICNGFQVMAKMGLLPEPLGVGHLGETEFATPTTRTLDHHPRQSVTLADNTSGRFIDRWVRLRAEPQSVCVWTRGIDALDLPIAHGEGRFVAESVAVMDRLRTNHQVALRYDGENPNGSTDAIAGICDPSGVVLGLMPHPERYVTATQHPSWTRQAAEQLTQTTPGLRMFQNAVEHVRQKQTVTA